MGAKPLKMRMSEANSTGLSGPTKRDERPANANILRLEVDDQHESPDGDAKRRSPFVEDAKHRVTLRTRRETPSKSRRIKAQRAERNSGL